AGREQLSLAISTSGTVTLENALMGIPMIVTYKLPWPTYFLIKSLIRVSTITIVNLIMNENIVPEYIQRNAMPGLIANVATAWLKDPPALDKIREKFKSLRSRLGEEGVYERTARSILEKIHE
ncbi:MAG: lipid-A-disaccharide synthase, partial [Elusimicrobia bacterium]|nr:lipid-A-disaccharide synthase [Elusimicrobiota bacterium]